MKSVGIIGIGKFVPEKVIRNDDFVKLGLETSDEWILSRTGIKERRITAENEATSDLAYKAAEEAILDAGIKKEDIGLIIVATTSPDYPTFPSTACIVQERLGLGKIGAFDLSAACSGFCYGVTTGYQFVQTGKYKNVLVIGADCLSKFVDWEDRSICVLFGDGAGAVVLSEVEAGYGLLASDMYSDGSFANLLISESGGSRNVMSQDVLEAKAHLIKMDGKAVFKVAINSVLPSIFSALDSANLKPEDIDYFVPHQANLRIIGYTKEKLGLKDEQVVINIDKYGNTSAASIPIAMEEFSKKGKFKDGDIIVFSGFGAGFTWATSIIKWKGK